MTQQNSCGAKCLTDCIGVSGRVWHAPECPNRPSAPSSPAAESPTPSAPREAPETPPREGERDESLDQLREEIRKQRYALGGQMVLPVAFAERLASRLSASEARVKELEREQATMARMLEDEIAMNNRLAARAAAAEQRADAEVEIKAEMFDNWTNAEARLASLLEKIEHDEADYRRRAKETEWDERHANETAANALAAVRSLLAPSEDTSDGK